MTIGGWVGFISIVIMLFIVAFLVSMEVGTSGKVAAFAIAICISIATLGIMLWYFNGTADGQRQLVDQRSNFSNGLERVVTVYTADGNVIAQYEGQIDIEANDGGYIKFDFEGKRYMYYNCFVESIADIE